MGLTAVAPKRPRVGMLADHHKQIPAFVREAAGLADERNVVQWNERRIVDAVLVQMTNGLGHVRRVRPKHVECVGQTVVGSINAEEI